MSHPFCSSLTHISLLWQFLKSETLVGKPIEGFTNCLIKGIIVCGEQESYTMLYLVSESQPIALYVCITKIPGERGPCSQGCFLNLHIRLLFTLVGARGNLCQLA